MRLTTTSLDIEMKFSILVPNAQISSEFSLFGNNNKKD